MTAESKLHIGSATIHDIDSFRGKSSRLRLSSPCGSLVMQCIASVERLCSVCVASVQHPGVIYLTVYIDQIDKAGFIGSICNFCIETVLKITREKQQAGWQTANSRSTTSRLWKSIMT